MRKEYIEAGMTINTIAGDIEIKNIRDDVATVIEREYDEDGNETSAEELLLTESDIARRMKEVDGQNHQVVFR